MKKALLLGLVLMATTGGGFGQAGGGGLGGASGYRTPDYGGNPALRERNKRQPTAAETKDDGSSTFIDASVLMNVKADEYVAVFGIVEDGKTVTEANAKMDATLSRFKDSLKPLAVKEADVFVDFVLQNRTYAYQIQAPTAKEELAGFELKKNVSIHFKDKMLLDQMVRAAALAEVFDLIKVDYVVQDTAAVQATLRAEAARIIKSKAERYQSLLRIKLSDPAQMVLDSPSIYYPIEQYDSYTAAESQTIEIDRSRFTVLGARKSRTFYFNPLSGDGFDTVINPVIIEPVVQFTAYVKVKYEAGKAGKNVKK